MHDSDTSPFIDVTVQPSYGKQKVLIRWVVTSKFRDAKFYVFRSENNGGGNWKAVSTAAVSGNTFEDTEFYLANRLMQVFYKVILIKDGKDYESPSVSAFDKLTRSEYGAAKQIMNYEYLRMSRGNGLRVFHYLPLVDGEINPDYDEETGQQLIATCPDDGSYGLKYKGGYGPPLQTWAEFLQIRESLSVAQGDMGLDDKVTIAARLLAFPKPLKNHLIIHPPTDNRYIVGDELKGSYFKGFVATSYDVELTLLDRSDPRYNVPVPQLNNDPVPWR
jgi:hypothetical protein